MDDEQRRTMFAGAAMSFPARRVGQPEDIANAVLLVRALATWRQVMQGRENLIVDYIYRYCRENIFDTGVFLVGAAHRSGIVKAIEKLSHRDADWIEWNLHL